MAVTRNFVKGCCGGNGTIVMYTDKPILKHHVEIFKNAGYTTLDRYLNSGIFYVRKDSLVATSSFGTTKVNVKCGVHKREEKLNEFERLLDQAIGS